MFPEVRILLGHQSAEEIRVRDGGSLVGSKIKACVRTSLEAIRRITYIPL